MHGDALRLMRKHLAEASMSLSLRRSDPTSPTGTEATGLAGVEKPGFCGDGKSHPSASWYLEGVQMN